MILRWLSGLFGVVIIVSTLLSVVKTFVLPRNPEDWLYNQVFDGTRKLFRLPIRYLRGYAARERFLALLAPVSLLALLPAWYGIILIGFMFLFWAVEPITFFQAFRVSGSSLFTLGFDQFQSEISTIIEFIEAMIGLLLVALLMAYLPTIYAAFSRRESLVTLLEIRAGSPPSAVEMIKRHFRIHGLERLNEVWRTWEAWFADIEESHTSLPSLVFFRSPRPERNWVSAAGAVLDGAALMLSAVDSPYDPQAALCLRGGYIALRSISDGFHLDYDPEPAPGDAISISKDEFFDAIEDLRTQGVPLKQDLEAAWVDFAGWRVNYDEVLLQLAGLVLSPETQWVGDRAIQYWPREKE